jgi:DNA polymerase III delta prime subunit
MEYDIRNNQTTLIEKYKPTQNINQIVLTDLMKTKIKQFIETKKLPNIILEGQSGVGKSILARCIGKELYQKYYKDVVLELNASDDKSMKNIQQELSTFCKKVLPYPEKVINNYVPYKLVILDEIDNMDDKHQNQISTLMTKTYSKVRYIFTCNSLSKILESIQTNCCIIKYECLPPKLMVNILINICKQELIEFKKSALNIICEYSKGDVRNAINMLQLVINTVKLNNAKTIKITEKNVCDACDIPHYDLIKEIFDYIISNKLSLAIKSMQSIICTGYSNEDILLGMIYTIKSSLSDDIEEKTKMNFYNCISETYYNISKSSNTELQIIACIINMYRSLY